MPSADRLLSTTEILEYFAQEIASLQKRVENLERCTTVACEKFQGEVSAESQRVKLRIAELEQKNTQLLSRLALTERRAQFELSRFIRPNIGFDKIGIA